MFSRNIVKGCLPVAVAMFFAGTAYAEGQPQVGSPPPSADVLASAKPGECYAKQFQPAEYSTKVQKVLKREATHRIEIIPAKYEVVKEKVVVKEPSTRLVKVPAVYETVAETIETEPARTIWTVGAGRSKGQLADDGLIVIAKGLGLPVDSAKPGQCFDEFFVAARFETRKEKVLVQEAAHRIEIIPAKYEFVNEKVVIAEPQEKITEVAAQYAKVTEQVLVKPAHQMWKKGRGPIERVDNATGEIMCLVEVPAQYKTVSKRVLKAPATTRKVEIPAKYKTVKVRKLVQPAQEKKIEIPAEYGTVTRQEMVAPSSRVWGALGSKGLGERTGQRLCLNHVPAKTKTVKRRAVKSPATTKKIEIPAEYKTIQVRKLVRPAEEKRIEIPAEYVSVSKRALAREGRTSWLPVLCETNTTPGLVSQIQRGLKKAGHNPGPIDGIIGRQTTAALRSFQSAKGLQGPGITMSTLDALGIKAR
jgi:regulator of extracellular matrix RemA (YlzA/DUF370 family)